MKKNSIEHPPSAAGRELLAWLLEGDPAVCWQVYRDLLSAGAREVLAQRKRVSQTGWGARLLSCQDADGGWGGALYSKKWVSATYSLLLLKELGVLPCKETLRGCRLLFENGIYMDEEIRFSKKQQLRDNGVTAMVLGILCYFEYEDERLHRIASFLLNAQEADGSWLYDKQPAAADYAFDCTLLVLKSLLDYQKRYPGKSGRVKKAMQKGNEFLLKHHLFLDMQSGKPIRSRWTKFTYPSYWFYDVPAALDYFRETGNPDPRMTEAVNLVLGKQNRDGTWNLQGKYPGKTFFDMEAPGKPSRWNTLRCLRILKWWNEAKKQRRFPYRIR